MEFEYDVKDNEILLKRCYGTEERIEVPAQIEGMPVTVLAPYIFSQARREPDQKAAICGNQVKEIVLPDTVREIGNYAFYGCYYLEALTLSHRTHDIAGGAFTGCRHLKNLTFRMEQAEGYCMKDVLSEVHHELMEKARLSQDAEGVYQSYLMEHRMSAAGWCIEFEQNETLEFLTGFIDWQEGELSDLIEEANAKGRLEIQSVLMDYKHQHFGKKKKTFDL